MMIALGLMFSMAVTSAFATDEKISPRVLESFKKEFSTAQEVNWITGNNYYRAAFKTNGQYLFAYYTLDGELAGAARYISSLQLPINLLAKLKKEYSQYWVSDLFEVSNSEGTHYYITLEDADTSLMLKSTNSSEWSSYNKKSKN